MGQKSIPVWQMFDSREVWQTKEASCLSNINRSLIIHLYAIYMHIKRKGQLKTVTFVKKIKDVCRFAYLAFFNL